MNEQNLDDLMAAHGKDYNAPPVDPPLLEIRNRVYAARRRRSARLIAGTSMAAAAAIVLAVGLMTTRTNERMEAARPGSSVSPVASSNPHAAVAERAVVSALVSAEEARMKNPDDPYYIEHFATMKSNAEYFRNLRQRHAGGSI